MPISLLRKPPRPAPVQQPIPTINASALNLPDLTGPLVDTRQWRTSRRDKENIRDGESIVDSSPDSVSAPLPVVRQQHPYPSYQTFQGQVPAQQLGQALQPVASYNAFVTKPRSASASAASGGGPSPSSQGHEDYVFVNVSGSPPQRPKGPTSPRSNGGSVANGRNAYPQSPGSPPQPGASQPMPIPMPMPKGGSTPSSPAAAGRQPSHVKDTNGRTPDFHRPFSPFASGKPLGASGFAPTSVTSFGSPPGTGFGGGFAPSAYNGPGSEAGHESIYQRTGASTPGLNSRPGTIGRGRRGRKQMVTAIVAGSTGAGKSSFIDALSAVLDPAVPRTGARMRATTTILRHEVVSADDRRPIVLIDTPGLPVGEGKTVADTRTRAVGALVGMIETRLTRLLEEENKVVRRKSDGGEMVHLVIYLIDARAVLFPAQPVEVEWDTIAEPPSGVHTRPESDLVPGDPFDLEARLSMEDIEAIRRFSVRANVMPILTHADALSTIELDAVRDAVRRDLASVFGREPLGEWGVLRPVDEEDEEEEEGEEGREGSVSDAAQALNTDGDGPSTQEQDSNSPSGRSDSPHRVKSKSRDIPDLPYAVFAPEPGPGLERRFRWGAADAGDAEHNDLPLVREAVVKAAEWLRVTTREVVYERFRTERLLDARVARMRTTTSHANASGAVASVSTSAVSGASVGPPTKGRSARAVGRH